MIVVRLPLKQPSGVGVWSRYRKKFELAAKKRLIKCFLMTSSTWIINVIYTFTYKKLILNVICKNGK